MKSLRFWAERVVNAIKFSQDPLCPSLVGIPIQPASSVNTCLDIGKTTHVVNFSLTDAVLGVPKYRTCKPKKMTKKFGFPKLYNKIEGLVNCKTCGSVHLVRTVCGTCYEAVRQETNEVKREKLGLIQRGS